MRNREYDMHLRLNEAEYRKLGELAQKAGVTRSVVLRKLIMGTEIKACEHYSDYLRRKERNSDEAR